MNELLPSSSNHHWNWNKYKHHFLANCKPTFWGDLYPVFWSYVPYLILCTSCSVIDQLLGNEKWYFFFGSYSVNLVYILRLGLYFLTVVGSVICFKIDEIYWSCLFISRVSAAGYVHVLLNFSTYYCHVRHNHCKSATIRIASLLKEMIHFQMSLHVPNKNIIIQILPSPYSLIDSTHYSIPKILIISQLKRMLPVL